MNLTKVNGTYSKELAVNMTEIRKSSFDSSVSTEDMRALILDIISPAWIEAIAKKRFIGYLNNCASKKDMYWLCYNTVQKAAKYQRA